MGIGESGGFEARNLPPEMNALLHSLDMQLKNMGQKGVTKKEAKMLFKAGMLHRSFTAAISVVLVFLW